jgi:hypothetical protein
METVTLLAEGRAAGLDVRPEGDQLVVRGPKAAEPLALRLFEREGEVLAELEAEACGAALEQAEAALAAMSARLDGLYRVGERGPAERLDADIRRFIGQAWLPAKCRHALALERTGRLGQDDETWLRVAADIRETDEVYEPDPRGGWRLTLAAEARCVFCRELLAPGDRLFCPAHRDAHRRRYPDYPTAEEETPGGCW